jgi:hypothetical protein
MDIHRPKPWHGVREFLKEYLIIVVGVLTALAGEQVVENLHWRERTQQANETLMENLHGLSAPVQATPALQSCDQDLLDRLARGLTTSGGTWRPPFILHTSEGPVVLSTPAFMLESESWRTVQADGTANHLPNAKEALYAVAYDRMAQLQASNNQLVVDVSELNALATARDIDPQSRTGYLRLIYRIKAELELESFGSEQILTAMKGLGVKLQDPKGDEVLKGYQQVCAAVRAGKTDVTLPA